MPGPPLAWPSRQTRLRCRWSRAAIINVANPAAPVELGLTTHQVSAIAVWRWPGATPTSPEPTWRAAGDQRGEPGCAGRGGSTARRVPPEYGLRRGRGGQLRLRRRRRARRAAASLTSPTRPRRSRSGTTRRQVPPMAWQWPATTPTSPIRTAGCASSTWPTRPAPVEVGIFATPGDALGVTVAGNYAYVADPTAGCGLSMWRESGSHRPRSGSTHPGSVGTLRWRAAIAYLRRVLGGLRIINVANPAAPGGWVLRHAGIGAGCDGSGQLRLRGRSAAGCVSSTSPTRPRPSRSGPTTRQATPTLWRWRGATLTSLIPAAACASSTSPTPPRRPRSGSTILQGAPMTWRSSGGYGLCRRWQYSGLRMIDVANPAAPTEVGFYDTPEQASGVAVAGSYAYVADGESGLRVINVTNPAAPVEAGFYDTSGYAEGVALAGNFVYVADSSKRAAGV